MSYSSLMISGFCVDVSRTMQEARQSPSRGWPTLPGFSMVSSGAFLSSAHGCGLQADSHSHPFQHLLDLISRCVRVHVVEERLRAAMYRPDLQRVEGEVQARGSAMRNSSSFSSDLAPGVLPRSLGQVLVLVAAATVDVQGYGVIMVTPDRRDFVMRIQSMIASGSGP